MKSRAELEALLAAQRSQRRSVPPPRRRGRNLLGALAVILTLLASGGVMYFAVQLTTPPVENTPTILPSHTASLMTSATVFQTTTPTPLMVCTDIPDGRLHVRFAAGDGSEVRGYLTEGESVLPTANTETLKGETWQQIASPIAGWVNARYLCPAE
jgi:hypothetical protein